MQSSAAGVVAATNTDSSAATDNLSISYEVLVVVAGTQHYNKRLYSNSGCYMILYCTRQTRRRGGKTIGMRKTKMKAAAAFMLLE